MGIHEDFIYGRCLSVSFVNKEISSERSRNVPKGMNSLKKCSEETVLGTNTEKAPEDKSTTALKPSWGCCRWTSVVTGCPHSPSPTA